MQCTLCLMILLIPLVSGWSWQDRRREFMRRQQEECNKPADIVFVLDESGSIWGPDFDSQLDFVKSVVEEFDVSDEMVHIGTMTFSDLPDIHFHLDDWHGRAQINTALGEITQRRGGTKTYDAIEAMRTTMFTSEHMRYNVPHIGIVITDGESDKMELTKQQAEEAHRSGITMFAIGVGHQVNIEELRNIASESDYVFVTDSYDALSELRELLAKTTCEVTTMLPPTTTTTTTTTTTPAPTTLPQSIEECNAHFPADVQFAMSDQAGVAGTAKSIDFINSVVERLTLGPQQSQAAVTPRLCDTEQDAIRLKDNDNYVGFSRMLGGRELTGTNTAEHLRYMHNEGILPSGGARGNDEVARFGILIVDNKANDKASVLKQADKARKDGIHLMVVGIGPYVEEDELSNIASTNDDWFHIADYNALAGLTDPVMDRICDVVLDKAQQHG